VRPPLDILKIIWLGFWVGFVTIIMFVPITAAALLSRTGNLAFSLAKLWAWIMLKVGRAKPVLKNRHYIKPGQSYVVVSNHQSLFDIPALVTSLGLQFRWIIKKEILRIPLFGYALYASRNIFIDRSKSKDAMAHIREAMDRLPPGTSVFFFAEGTRSYDGNLLPFKKGGFVMALEKKLPILPVTVNGSRKVLAKNSIVFHPGPIEVIIGEPIDTHEHDTANLEELIEKTRETIISHLNPDYP